MFLFKDQIYLSQIEAKRDTFVIVGVDEVGRGPLAGPVVTASAALKFKKVESGLALLKILETSNVTDSKKLTPLKRRKILKELSIDIKKIEMNHAFIVLNHLDATLSISLNLQEAKVIDEINILKASLLSTKYSVLVNLRFLDKLVEKYRTVVFIDGNQKIDLEDRENTEINCCIKGDQNYLLIALASIVAKEYRDYLMDRLSKTFPQYGFEKHSGYGTKLHMENIKKFGPSSIHRKTFLKWLEN